MSKPQPIERLIHTAVGADGARAAKLIRSSLREPEPSLSPLKWRIRNTLVRSRERRRRHLLWATVGLLLFSTGGVVGAVVGPAWRQRASAPAATPVAVTRTAAPRPRVARLPPETPSAALPPEAISVAPALVPARSAPAIHARHAARMPPPVAVDPAPEVPSSPLAAAPAEAAPPAPSAPAQATPPLSEQRLLARVLQRLRSAHDGRGALAALDEYASQYPTGTLAPEASRLRTEALMLLGRRGEVLTELDGVVLAHGDERLILRGELRAAQGRWQAALDDFQAVLQVPARDARWRQHRERALWGRASARSHLGDESGARADLVEYARLYPQGRFSGEAARLLAGQTP